METNTLNRTITRRALIARVNRALAKEGKQLTSSLSAVDIAAYGLDSYVIEDKQTAAFVQSLASDARLVEYAKENGLMKLNEILALSDRLDERYKIEAVDGVFYAYLNEKIIGQTSSHADSLKLLREQRGKMLGIIKEKVKP